MRKVILSFSALISAALHIRAEYWGPLYQVYVFKPLTMAFIITLAALLTAQKRRFYAYAVLGGLIFSLAGDIFLMLPSDQFMLGLVSFLIAHLFYIAAFTRSVRFRFVLWPPVICVLYGLLIYVILFPSLGGMKVPVLIYMIVILFMGWRAYERWASTGRRPAFYALIGAVLFVISDSILAVNRFRFSFDAASLLILGTYFTAQWLITLSISGRNSSAV